MEPLYTKKCTHCYGSGKELQEDIIRHESWYEKCKYCAGTGQEPVYSQEDYLKLEQEKRKRELLQDKEIVERELYRLLEEVVNYQTRLNLIISELNQLSSTT